MKQEMTKKERFIATINRQSCDRLPTQLDFSPHMLDVMCKHYGVPQKGEEELLPYIDNHIVYCFLNDTFGMLRRRVKPPQKICYDDWGVGWDLTQEGLFPVVHPLEDEDQILKYEFPDPYRQNLLDLTKESVFRYGKDYIVSSYQVTLLFERAYALRGYENFLCDLAGDLEFAEELLEKITRYQVEVAKRYVKLGVSCGRTGDDYGTQKGMLFSPDLWRKAFKPRLKRVIDVYKEARLPIIHHSCGNILPIIPDLIEIGVDVLNNVQPEAMPRDLLVPFADQLVFYGGISTQNILPKGTEKEISDEVQACINTLGKKNGLILSTGISILTDVPISNLNHLLKAFNQINGSKNVVLS